MDLDWKTAEEGARTRFKAGVYHVEVKKVENKISQQADATPFFKLSLHVIDEATNGVGPYLCTDNLMFGGNGWPMSAQKLFALIGGKPKSIEPSDVLYKRAYVSVMESEWDGKPVMKVAIKEGPHNGYWPESKKPANAIEWTAPQVVKEETPF